MQYIMVIRSELRMLIWEMRSVGREEGSGGDVIINEVS